MIDHDRLFKELLSTFFVEFLALFLPEVVEYIEPESITFLDKEIFTDVTAGDKYETDLLAQVQFRGEPSFFLIHVENQATSKAAFGKRMFRYFARLFEKHDCQVYPIVVFSYDQPKVLASNEFRVDFPDFSVLRFNYRVIQLNQLNWRDFIDRPNPVASALMAKMKIEPEDRPKVKVECLRLLTKLQLDPAKMQLISGFFDTYLKLAPEEESAFNIEINRTEPQEQEKIMQIMNDWTRKGLEQGRQEGRQEGRQAVERIVLRMVTKELGTLPLDVQTQLKGLSEQQIDRLFDCLPSFGTVEALSSYLNQLKTTEDSPA
ncbi:MAG: DUF4351 domain-containing protein [Phormidesmis sp.]